MFFVTRWCASFVYEGISYQIHIRKVKRIYGNVNVSPIRHEFLYISTFQQFLVFMFVYVPLLHIITMFLFKKCSCYLVYILIVMDLREKMIKDGRVGEAAKLPKVNHGFIRRFKRRWALSLRLQNLRFTCPFVTIVKRFMHSFGNNFRARYFCKRK